MSALSGREVFSYEMKGWLYEKTSNFGLWFLPSDSVTINKNQLSVLQEVCLCRGRDRCIYRWPLPSGEALMWQVNLF